ncbi:MAG: alpha-1,2-fucosyltransferase [Lachnospiraceae bacterium]|nr:alpha-1,2-fucosyltransferase [Lachnospiraceae bacterium]
MLIVKLKDQLGNQMFSYASVKSIALKRNLKFGYYRMPLDEKYINDTDVKYGNDLSTIFNLPLEEQIKLLPDNITTYCERKVNERNREDYKELVINEIPDDCIVDGHFITSEFINDYKSELGQWFRFPDDVHNKIINKVSELKNNTGAPIVSVHFRVGKDYFERGYRLDSSYWEQAANIIKKRFPDAVFVCLYDKKNKAVKRFMEKFNAIDARGSLVDDLCLISQCDINIVCNSTFSIMGALLNNNGVLKLCPSIYPSSNGYNLIHVYPKDWVKVDNSKVDRFSRFVGGIRRYLIKIKRIFIK